MMNSDARRPASLRRGDRTDTARARRSRRGAATRTHRGDEARTGHLALETGRARPHGSGNIGSQELSGAWNFHLASLYNAAMLRLPARTHGCPEAARARTPGRRGTVLPARTRGLALAVLFSSMALSLTAHAQAPTQPAVSPDAKPRAEAKPTSAGKAKAASRGGNKVISLDDEFLVEGKLEKPSAFYVLRRSSTDYDWARLDAVFTPLVLESVQDPLF